MPMSVLVLALVVVLIAATGICGDGIAVGRGSVVGTSTVTGAAGRMVAVKIAVSCGCGDGTAVGENLVVVSKTLPRGGESVSLTGLLSPLSIKSV